MNKHNDDTDAEKRILKNENMTLSSQLKVTKEELSEANSKLKIQFVVNRSHISPAFPNSPALLYVFLASFCSNDPVHTRKS